MYVLSTAARNKESSKRDSREAAREREKEGVVINAEREDNPIGSAFIR